MVGDTDTDRDQKICGFQITSHSVSFSVALEILQDFWDRDQQHASTTRIDIQIRTMTSHLTYQKSQTQLPIAVLSNLFFF